MATGSSEATSPDTEFGIKDISALHEALCPVSAKYKFFGLQIGVDINEIKKIEADYKDSSDCLLEILLSRLNQELALTCADICKALRSEVVNMRQLANSFPSRLYQSIGDQNKETERESSKKKKAEKVSDSGIPLRMSEKESEDESESENIQSAEVERQVHERDEPKSKRAKKRACKKERAVKSQYASEQPVSESVIQLRMSKKEESEGSQRIESENESKSDKSENIQKAEKSAEIERQVHERDEPKSIRQREIAGKKERSARIEYSTEEQTQMKHNIDEMKDSQKKKNEMAVSSQSRAKSSSDDVSEKVTEISQSSDVEEENESDDESMTSSSQKGLKPRKENESETSSNERSDFSTEAKQKSVKSKKAVYYYEEEKLESELVKHKQVKGNKENKLKNSGNEVSMKGLHSVYKRAPVTAESDEDTSGQPFHKSKRKMEAEETKSEESFSESTSDESETESPKHKELMVRPKSLSALEMCCDSDEEMEKVRARDKKKKMPHKSKVATAKHHVNEFRCRFNNIAEATILCLIACNIAVATMPFFLTQITTLDDHKLFLDKKIDEFGKCETHWVLFGKLNLYWNYLAYDLLYQLIKVLYNRHKQFKRARKDVIAYKKDIKQFMKCISLKLFCEIEQKLLSLEGGPPAGFKELVLEFNWPNTVTLEAVETFRQRYARQYRLNECAMIIKSIKPGSFKVTWFVPISIIDILIQRMDIVQDLLKELNVMRLIINGNCIYQYFIDEHQKLYSQLKERKSVEETKRTWEREVKKKKKERSVSHKKEKAKKDDSEEERKLIKKRVSKAVVEPSKCGSPQGGRQLDETHTRKVKGKFKKKRVIKAAVKPSESDSSESKFDERKMKRRRLSETIALKYELPGDNEQLDSDQEEHDIQKKRGSNRIEISMSPTAIGISSPSTSQEEKKKQPVSKKQGHRKKHVRKMKERRKRMMRGKEKAAHSSSTDDSSPECDMTKNQYKDEMKELVNIFERFFGKLCCAVFDPKDVAAELQSVGLISIESMKHIVRSPESKQDKIITLVDLMHKMMMSCPDHLFVIIEVMLENEALQETAREILRETGTQCLVCELHFVLDSKTLFPAGRVCPVETAAKFPSQVPPSDTAVPSTADTLSPTAKGML